MFPSQVLFGVIQYTNSEPAHESHLPFKGASNSFGDMNSCSRCDTSRRGTYCVAHKLQALVYDILPSTTAVFSYAIGSRKLSANEQFFVVVFFVGAQTVVSLLQTTQIKQGMSYIATNKVYTSTNKTTIV